MRKPARIVLTVFLVLLVALVGTALVFYSMLRHQPALYRPPEGISAAERESAFQVFEGIRKRAEEQYYDRGAFAATATTEQLNAVIARYESSPEMRGTFQIPAELHNLQVVIQPGRAVVMALMPTDAGSVVVSAYVTIVSDGEPHLKVGDVYVGSLAVPRERAQRLIEKIERQRFVFPTADGNRLRITTITLDDGLVTVTGVRERP